MIILIREDEIKFILFEWNKIITSPPSRAKNCWNKSPSSGRSPSTEGSPKRYFDSNQIKLLDQILKNNPNNISAINLHAYCLKNQAPPNPQVLQKALELISSALNVLDCLKA